MPQPAGSLLDPDFGPYPLSGVLPSGWDVCRGNCPIGVASTCLLRLCPLSTQLAKFSEDTLSSYTEAGSTQVPLSLSVLPRWWLPSHTWDRYPILWTSP